MYYGVVEFKSRRQDLQELAIVPLTWLIKNERRCYWPTGTKKLPLEVFVKQCPPPNKNWHHFPVNKVHYKTVDYDSAEQEITRIIKEYETINSLSEASKHSVVERKYVSDTSESSDDDEPLVPKKPKMCEAKSAISSPARQELGNDVNVPALDTPGPSSTSTMTNFAITSEALNHDIIIEGLHNCSYAPSTVEDDSVSKQMTDSDFKDLVITSLAKLQTTNDQILLTMQEILRYNKKIALEKLTAPENLPNFPLNTYDDFLSFEALAKDDPIVSQYMVRRLAALGGSGVEGVTGRIMRFLLANQLSVQFNWKGRFNKIGFENTSTSNIVLEAAKLNFPAHEKNDMKVAWAVKEWLKHSSTRMNQGRREKDS
ncbi:unnamed protein product [Callosobruchus maculatus]|uniref:Uncharacterized protein n=1 Tax=Callosobruchus maculatus TaxID=64391 RepID=A0A653DU42_CALMS|nr:unnamed protein product [Callosobruchus maculatus]